MIKKGDNMWQIIIRTHDDRDYVAINDLLDFDLTTEKDKKELIEAIEEVFKNAQLETIN